MIVKFLHSILVGLAYLLGLTLFIVSQPFFLIFLGLAGGIYYYFIYK